MSTDTDTLYMAVLAKRNDELEDENKSLKDLLREIRPVLRAKGNIYESRICKA